MAQKALIVNVFDALWLFFFSYFFNRDFLNSFQCCFVQFTCVTSKYQFNFTYATTDSVLLILNVTQFISDIIRTCFQHLLASVCIVVDALSCKTHIFLRFTVVAYPMTCEVKHKRERKNSTLNHCTPFLCFVYN